MRKILVGIRTLDIFFGCATLPVRFHRLSKGKRTSLLTVRMGRCVGTIAWRVRYWGIASPPWQ